MLSGVAILVLVGVVGYLVVRLTTGGNGPPTPPSSPTPGAIKSPMQGLVLENAQAPKGSDAGTVGGIVAQVTWAQLQPAPHQDLPDGNVIDQALAMARSFNAAHPKDPIYVKIRLLAGVSAPSWVKTLGGFHPVQLANKQGGRGGTIGPFWTSAYLAAYGQLQDKLAARYDGNPLVRDNTISGCSTLFAEPFQRDDTGFSQLVGAGYTTADDQRCLLQEIDAHRAWRQTRQSLAVNPYRTWAATSAGVDQAAADNAFTERVMKYCRERLATLCTLENNSARSSWIQPGSAARAASSPALYQDLYTVMRTLGPPLTIQTAGPTLVGDLPTTVRWAIGLGANSVEIPENYDAAAMRRDNAALIANPTG